MSTLANLRKLHGFFRRVQEKYYLPAPFTPTYFKLRMMERQYYRRITADPYKHRNKKYVLATLSMIAFWAYMNGLFTIKIYAESATENLKDSLKGGGQAEKVKHDKVTFDDIKVS